MRTQGKSIVTALVLLSLVSGAIGCRSNGSGAWYNPKSYSWHNPFKESEAPPYHKEGEAQAQHNSKPSLDAQPNIQAPPGGYAMPTDEAGFFAGSQTATPAPYGQGNEMNRVAAATYNAPAGDMAATPYSPAGYTMPEAYNPYPSTDPNATASGYQPTRYQQAYEQPGMTAPVTTSPAAPAIGSYPAVGATPATDPIPAYASPVIDPNAASPYAAPQPYPQPMTQPVQQPVMQPQPADATSPYANAQATYGAPAATPYTVDPSANPYGAGYSANPSSYQPTTTGGF